MTSTNCRTLALMGLLSGLAAPLSAHATFCQFYSENFDDGTATDATTGIYQVRWCDTYIPLSSNTPSTLCSQTTGRTLRTNSSTQDPTIWVSRGNQFCTHVRIRYNYYQYAYADTGLQYLTSNDTSAVCEKSGIFSAVASHSVTQACGTQEQIIPFNGYNGVYIRLEHGSTSNAIWIDNLTLELDGCSC
ncbi:MAG TPA: hypothetical protein VEU50_04445 [Archangium sp.]|nr:hypothetical protein [Archangium sp.]